MAQEKRYHWPGATGLPTARRGQEKAPQGALVPDRARHCDQVAVVYNKGERPPEITVEGSAGKVQTVLADGIAVAVVASAWGPAISADDVLLVERCL